MSYVQAFELCIQLVVRKRLEPAGPPADSSPNSLITRALHATLSVSFN